LTIILAIDTLSNFVTTTICEYGYPSLKIEAIFMKKKLLILILTSIAMIPISYGQKKVPAKNTASPFELAPMVKQAMPSVVSVMVKQDFPLGKHIAKQMKDDPTAPTYRVPELSILGAGVMVDSADGLLVTNAHVIRGAKQIVIFAKDNARYLGKLIGKSDDFDIAIIQINTHTLPAVEFADSDHVDIGDFVVAIGNPYGLSQTVTSGIVSAVHRTQSFWPGLQNLIQTDAPINLGNSGGPLLNIHGQLIGINTAIFAPSEKDPGNIGLGFSIPSNEIKSIVSQFKKYGDIKYGSLGVIIQDLTPDLQHAFQLPALKGCLVTQVVKNSPAFKANIQPADIILAINDRPVTTAAQLRSMIVLSRPGTHKTLTLWRHQKKQTLEVILVDPKKITANKVSPLSGLTLQTFNELESNGDMIQGLGIVNVEENSMGELAGLHRGDIILSANHQRTTNIQTLEGIAKNENTLLLEILRNKGRLFVVLKNNRLF
jgi:Do/DeqQ family serine protease